MKRGELVLLVVGLSGCGADSMAGDWAGDLTCSDGATVDAEIELDEPEEGLTYTGDYYFQAFNNQDIDGDTWRFESDWAGAVTVKQVADKGEQEVDIVLEARTPNCRVYKNGNQLSTDCYYDGNDIGFTLPDDLVGTWDGLDAMELESLRCQGDITR